MMHQQPIVIVMGPTGSGKSALAIALAEKHPCVIINADAMQMVDGLRALTARPTAEEESQAEHALYGVLKPQEPTSVARWLAMLQPVVERAWAEKKMPLIVGGTGMYVKALMEGLNDMPAVPEAIRVRVRGMDAAALYAELREKDPAMAAKLKPGDTQRLARALEMVDATGTSLAQWQEQKTAPLFPQADYQLFYLAPEREALYRRLDARFLTMMEQGALEEVRALMAMELAADTPILRAHGAPELAALLRGEMTREEAIAKAQQNTRNYAKRQMTWLRNQLPQALKLEGDTNSQVTQILKKIA